MLPSHAMTAPRARVPTARPRPRASGLPTILSVALPLALPLALSLVTPGCAVGNGEGSVKGSLTIPDCDADLSNYDMNADFFAASVSYSQLIITIQHGGGSSEYADTVTIAVQDFDAVQQAIVDSGAAHKATFDIAAFERPPGAPVNDKPPPVRLSALFRGSCGTQRFNPGDVSQVGLVATKGTIEFTSIFHGSVQSRETNDKRIEGTFHVDVEDPRGWGTKPAKGHLDGTFKFFYQRGGPAQPFP